MVWVPLSDSSQSSNLLSAPAQLLNSMLSQPQTMLSLSNFIFVGIALIATLLFVYNVKMFLYIRKTMNEDRRSKLACLGDALQQRPPIPIQLSKSFHRSSDEDLPNGWERAVTAEGYIYYIDHVTRTTTWLHPKELKNQSKSTKEGTKTKRVTKRSSTNTSPNQSSPSTPNMSPKDTTTTKKKIRKTRVPRSLSTGQVPTLEVNYSENSLTSSDSLTKSTSSPYSFFINVPQTSAKGNPTHDHVREDSGYISRASSSQDLRQLQQQLDDIMI